MPIGLFVAALLLPPLAIFLDEGMTRNFWIAFALTCLGFFPGVVFAFAILLRKRRGTVEAEPQTA